MREYDVRPDLAAVKRVVVAFVQIEPSFRLGFRLPNPLDVVKARLHEWEQPCKRRSPVELPIPRVHVRIVLDRCGHVEYVAGVFACLRPERLCRRHFRFAEKTGGLQAGRHRELQRHGYPSLDHIG